jgi:hypothetical protein
MPHFTQLLSFVQGHDNDFENFGMVFFIFMQIFPFDLECESGTHSEFPYVEIADK